MSYDPQQPPYGQPQQPPYGQPQYGGMPLSAPPQKRSLRWLWITLAIVGGVVVLACGGCALVFGFLGKTVVDSRATVDNYYNAIQEQDYNKAYSYLKIDRLTVGGQNVAVNQPTYARLASGLDTAKGKVTGHSITSSEVVNDTATVKVNVTRNGNTYPVAIQLKKDGDSWKITRFDNI